MYLAEFQTDNCAQTRSHKSLHTKKERLPTDVAIYLTDDSQWKINIPERDMNNYPTRVCMSNNRMVSEES